MRDPHLIVEAVAGVALSTTSPCCAETTSTSSRRIIGERAIVSFSAST
jgi:hypothetical protein